MERKRMLGQVSGPAAHLIQVARCNFAGQEVLPVMDGPELLKQEGEEKLVGSLGVNTCLLL